MPVNRGPRNANDFGDLSHGFIPGVIEIPSDLGLVGSQRPRAPTNTATSTSRFEASLGALLDDRLLELRHGTEDLEDQLAARCARIHAFGEAAEGDTSLLEVLDQGDEVLERTTESIESPDNDRVAGADPNVVGSSNESADRIWGEDQEVLELGMHQLFNIHIDVVMGRFDVDSDRYPLCPRCLK